MRLHADLCRFCFFLSCVDIEIKILRVLAVLLEQVHESYWTQHQKFCTGVSRVGECALLSRVSHVDAYVFSMKYIV